MLADDRLGLGVRDEGEQRQTVGSSGRVLVKSDRRASVVRHYCASACRRAGLLATPATAAAGAAGDLRRIEAGQRLHLVVPQSGYRGARQLPAGPVVIPPPVHQIHRILDHGGEVGGVRSPGIPSALPEERIGGVAAGGGQHCQGDD